MTDEATADAPAPESMTYEVFYRRTRDLADKVEKLASKATLVAMLASHTVHQTWWNYGSLEKVIEAENRLLADLKDWASTGRDHNRAKRTKRIIARVREMNAAIAEGRPLPKAPRRKRRRKVRP